MAELGQSQFQKGSERMQGGSDSAGEALRGCRELRQDAGGSHRMLVAQAGCRGTQTGVWVVYPNH